MGNTEIEFPINNYDSGSAEELPLYEINGHILKLFINEDGQYNITEGLLDIPLKVEAYYYGQEDITTTASLNLTAYDEDGLNLQYKLIQGADGDVGTGDDVNATIIGSGKTFFVQDGLADVKVGFGDLPIQQSSENTIFTGEGDAITGAGKNVIIHAKSSGNKIFGSEDNEKVKINNADNNIDTLGGNDTITLFWDNADDEGTLDNGSEHIINAGAGHDTLKIEATGAVDLNALSDDTFIKNIEVLQLSSGGTNTMTLDAYNVLQMTDSGNELTFENLQSNLVNLDLEGFEQVDSDGNGTADDQEDGQDYHEYEGSVGDQTVTLFVEADGVDVI